MLSEIGAILAPQIGIKIFTDSRVEATALPSTSIKTWPTKPTVVPNPECFPLAYLPEGIFHILFSSEMGDQQKSGLLSEEDSSQASPLEHFKSLVTCVSVNLSASD